MQKECFDINDTSLHLADVYFCGGNTFTFENNAFFLLHGKENYYFSGHKVEELKQLYLQNKSKFFFTVIADHKVCLLTFCRK